MSLPSFPAGYTGGYTGSAGGDLSGVQRVARKKGLPEPTQVTGQKGAGRADRLRSYIVHVVRESDGKRLERILGPGYHSKKHWQQARNKAFYDLLKELR